MGTGGQLSARPGPGSFWWFDTDPTLACVNEPPLGPGFEGDVNVVRSLTPGPSQTPSNPLHVWSDRTRGREPPYL